MKNTYIPETVNLHFHSACEMRCKHCFAVFRECGKQVLPELREVIRKIAEVPMGPGMKKPRRVNFVGGEPTIHPYFINLVGYANESGLRTSIVTNGYSLVRKRIPKELEVLDLVGVSIDSLQRDRNRQIGRSVNEKTISAEEWYRFFEELSALSIPLKINTTITRHNLDEDFSEFIKKANPLRWKIFQAMVVSGQNCQNSGTWKVSRKEYDTFISRHRRAGVEICPEPEDLMRGSYAMVSPDGRFFDSAEGYHRYSKPILDVGAEEAWNQVQCDEALFRERTRNY